MKSSNSFFEEKNRKEGKPSMSASAILAGVAPLVREYDMLPQKSLILCAVSGGADSMCLLHLLLSMAGTWGVTVFAAHFDHRIRGDESARDAAFVAEW